MFRTKEYTYVVEEMDAIQFAKCLGRYGVKFDIGPAKRVMKPNSGREISVCKFRIWATHKKMVSIIENWVRLSSPTGI